MNGVEGQKKLPEMRFFWIILGLFIVAAGISFYYLPGVLSLVLAAIFLAAAALVFFNTKKVARSSFEMHLEKDLLHTIVTSLQDAVVSYDKDFTVLVFNEAAEKLFGLRAEEVVGKKVTLEMAQGEQKYRLLGQVMYPSLAPMMTQRSDPGSAVHLVDLVFETPDYLELRVATAAVVDENGEQTGSIKVVRDRTREVQLLKSKNEFITVASHQLRTPLTAVNWVFEEALRPGVTEGERTESLKTGAQAAQRLNKIVNDFLDIAKMEEGRYGYKFEMYDIAAFLQKAVEEAQPIGKQYRVNVYLERPREGIQVPMDVQKMSIVVSNLIDNAIKYNVENGEVRVILKKVESQPFVEVIIEDTGIGISSEDINKLFTKFFRAENTMKMETAGSGLGLYLAKNIVEQHGGKIAAESIAGRGTKFFFSLPTDMSLVPQKEAQKTLEG